MKMLNFIDSDLYQTAIGEIQKQTGINIYPFYPEVLSKIEEEKLSDSNIDLDEINTLLKNNFCKIIEFSKSKLVKFDKIKIIQEYPKGKEPEKEEEDSNEVSQGYSKGFLLLNLIEYYFLAQKPEEIDSYFQKIKIPKRKEYINDLKDIF